MEVVERPCGCGTGGPEARKQRPRAAALSRGPGAVLTRLRRRLAPALPPPPRGLSWPLLLPLPPEVAELRERERAKQTCENHFFQIKKKTILCQEEGRKAKYNQNEKYLLCGGGRSLGPLVGVVSGGLGGESTSAFSEEEIGRAHV